MSDMIVIITHSLEAAQSAKQIVRIVNGVFVEYLIG